MGIADGEIDYQLIKPCQIITPKDGAETWQYATLREPTNQHARWYIKIEDMLGKALLDSVGFAGSDKEEESISTSGKEFEKFHDIEEESYEKTARGQVSVIKLLLINSDRVDRGKFIEIFEKMALANSDQAIISCNGSYRLKKTYWDAMSISDQLGIAYLWSAFFVMPSLQQGIA